MESVQSPVTGKRFTAAKLREVFLQVASSIPADAQIMGSVDTSSPNEVLTSFAYEGGVITLSLMMIGAKMKGGVTL